MKLPYRPALIIRIALIFIAGFVAFYIAFRTHFWLVSLWILLLIIIQIIELIRFHERSTKALKKFLISLKQDDFSNLYSFDEPDQRIRETYEILQEKIQTLHSSKEAHHHYLTMLFEHVNVALISLDQENRIHMMNNATKELFSIPGIKDLKPLEKIDRNLVKAIREVRSGESQVLKIIRHGEMLHLLIRSSEFYILDEYYKLVSFQDIKTEMEEKELESWQKLVRVLTHEITNSAIPITNLIGVIKDIVIARNGKQKKADEIEKKMYADLKECLETIEKRSRGLVNFVNATKSLTQVPKPSFKAVDVSNLFKRIHTLFKPKFKNNRIHFTTKVLVQELTIQADFELIEQVLINLIMNAIEALSDTNDPKIELLAYRKDEMQTQIEVKDNGDGIDEKVMDQIFIPYFTTKKNGSGIGLSLARQIMVIHKGKIHVSSSKGAGTSVILVF